jgi:hypothetical protein
LTLDGAETVRSSSTESPCMPLLNRPQVMALTENSGGKLTLTAPDLEPAHVSFQIILARFHGPGTYVVGSHSDESGVGGQFHDSNNHTIDYLGRSGTAVVSNDGTNVIVDASVEYQNPGNELFLSTRIGDGRLKATIRCSKATDNSPSPAASS